MRAATAVLPLVARATVLAMPTARVLVPPTTTEHIAARSAAVRQPVMVTVHARAMAAVHASATM